MLTAEQVTIRYPRFTLGPLSVALRPGERVALLGRNGAGKSTLLAVMAGQRHADAGTVRLTTESMPTTDRESRLELRRHVAYVGAGMQALPWHRVRQHFEFLQRVHDRWNAARAMDLARALRLDLEAVAGTLSRGNLVKLNLCAAWGQEASVLLLDEPTAGLDPVARTDLLQELQRFIEAHPTGSVVYATHLLDELRPLDPARILVLSDGTMREFDPAETHGFDVDRLTTLMSSERRPTRLPEVA